MKFSPKVLATTILTTIPWGDVYKKGKEIIKAIVKNKDIIDLLKDYFTKSKVNDNGIKEKIIELEKNITLLKNVNQEQVKIIEILRLRIRLISTISLFVIISLILYIILH